MTDIIESPKNVKSVKESTPYEGETFVHDGKEVVKTGRTATKRVKARREGKDTEVLLVEICPVSMLTISTAFNVWVEEIDLFHISDD